MGLDVFGIVGDSYSTLFRNRTVLLLAIAGVVLNAIALILLVAPAVFLVRSLSPAFTLFLTNPLQALRQILPPLIGYIWGAAAVVVLLLIAGNLLVVGAIISATEAGENTTLDSAVGQSRSRLFQLFGTNLLKSIFTFMGLIAFIIPGIYIAVKLAVSSVAAVAGKKDVVGSLQSSWSVTEGNMWSIIFILLILGVTTAVIGWIAGIAGRMVASLVRLFFAYTFVIASVLVYQKLSAPARKTQARQRARK